MGVLWHMGGYLGRIDALRVSASTGHPIALGYVMTVAAMFYLYLWPTLKDKAWSRTAASALMIGGIFAPLSRGPWMGGLAMVATFALTGPRGISRLLLLATGSLGAITVLTLLPGGEKVLNLLPFVGTVEADNIDYRGRLLEQSLMVAQRHPWLGSDTFLQAPEMESLIQGQGIIDIVNTYLQILLSSGLIGLSLFVGVFLSVAWPIYRTLAKWHNRECDEARMGRATLAALIGTMVTIFTTSSITVIPTVYWTLLGLGVAYVRLARAHPATGTKTDLPHIMQGTNKRPHLKTPRANGH